jgi:hypothetical protein
MIDPKSFKAPFIPREKAWSEAERIRREHWPSGAVPVEVEEVLWGVGLELTPVHSLKQAGDVDALLAGDLTRIIVDAEEYMDDRMQNRMRYSIAHERGHFVLHRECYQNIQYSSVDEWIEFVQSIPEDQYGYIEQHAYEFAGRLLVPVERLRSELASAVNRAQAAGFMEWDRSGDAAREYIGSSICRIFGVSSQVIEKRIVREQLWPPTR